MSAQPSAVIAALRQHAAATPQAPALRSARGEVSYAELAAAVTHAAEHLQQTQPRMLGLALDNGPAWAAVDLAALDADVALVPLPAFFSDAQLLHAMHDAGIDTVVTDQPQRFEALCAAAGWTIRARHACDILGQPLSELRLAGAPLAALPVGTAKITYTSGTTGTPKGVCLAAAALEQVALSLREATAAHAGDRHLALLPLSTLLENVAGLYVPLLAGASCTLLPLAETGLLGASGLQVAKLAGVLEHHAPTSTILTPEMLLALVTAAEAGQFKPGRLRFVAVGGAPVAPGLLQRAHFAGIPAYEGYGLSECASVVALNSAGAALVGSVGRPLPHVRLAFAADGEILVAGSTLLGYTGSAAPRPDGFWPSGDTGYLDALGFLHLTGRKKSIFITSFGRNVAPEWVERELIVHPAIAQAAVFGEARPWNVAVIVARGHGPDTAAQIEAAIDAANRRLPDYARIRRWLAADAHFSARNGLATANGRLRRAAIWAEYQPRIDTLYKEITHAVL